MYFYAGDLCGDVEGGAGDAGFFDGEAEFFFVAVDWGKLSLVKMIESKDLMRREKREEMMLKESLRRDLACLLMGRFHTSQAMGAAHPCRNSGKAHIEQREH